MNTVRSLLLVAALGAALWASASAQQPETLRACEALVTNSYTQWKYAQIRRDVAEVAAEQKFNPRVASGDFDGDGRTDVALLIEARGAIHVAICLNPASGLTLRRIDQPHCWDYLFVARKGSEYYNWETGATGRFAHDGISVKCFEQAGATYIYNNGSFERIVDDD